ncbi:multidrug ABC transporter ATP-binding protein [Kitasatospora sp. MMS16-BH015]|uniref:ABC transporter ATP-binding protein n=1 Tax=Kitasatospora sp. MMS16-BH015 TaxID=2018025 RepID=UPI000CA33F66|nr:ABC transporter ATP-binding protein [Kitasatospora sp. MMS16-BH015]AUG77113.1 multidrug ABC transporter ATP-binding protein [Kitasatospora sp. MMS16-BH015]
MAVIEVTGLRKAYGRRTVLDGVEFDVEEGEIFGLLGPNGAGKTTTVECCEGLRRPDAGTVRVLGLDPVRDARQLRPLVGVQLQQAQLQDNLRLVEALELYASFYPRPRPIGELLEQWGIADHAQTKFGKLSGGQRQRLFIALALIGRPEVVFLDELTTGLDPQGRRDTWELVRQVREEGVTVVLVSHFMDEVEALCDRAAVLDGGRITALGTPGELVARSGVGSELSFRTHEALSAAELRLLPGVLAVTEQDGRTVITGTGTFADEVTGLLARRGVVVTGLRVHEHTLDDAYLALTNRRR